MLGVRPAATSAHSSRGTETSTTFDGRPDAGSDRPSRSPAWAARVWTAPAWTAPAPAITHAVARNTARSARRRRLVTRAPAGRRPRPRRRRRGDRDGVPPPSRPARPRSAEPAGSASASSIAAASAAGSSTGTSQPVSPSRTSSGTKPTGVATTGRANDIASSNTSGPDSHRDGTTTTSAALSSSTGCCDGPVKVTTSSSPRPWRPAASHGASGPPPTTTACTGRRARHRRQGLEQHVEALLVVEPPDGHHERDRAVQPEVATDLVGRARGGLDLVHGRDGRDPPGDGGEPRGDLRRRRDHLVGAADDEPFEPLLQPAPAAAVGLHDVVDGEHERPATSRHGDPSGLQPVGVQHLGRVAG